MSELAVKNHNEERFRMAHYYGDIVRVLFLVAAIIMLVGMPAVTDKLHVPSWMSVGSILILGLSAGFTNPKLTISSVANVVIASVGMLVFESFTLRFYREGNESLVFLMVNFLLGFIFLIAIYFSVKSLRGTLMAKKES